MNFSESVAYLYSLGNEVAAMKLGLENIRRLLDALENPHRKYRKVQVAGTNGKGSVCAFLDAICLEAGIKTGLYTSPHLVSIRERIKIAGVDISEYEFAGVAGRVRELSERLVATGEIEYRPTFFEQITAIALTAFADGGVELAILETGLGGRLDATTAAESDIAAITRIDLDHQEYLGKTLTEIAAEKAAIIHADSLVCIGRQQPDAYSVIEERCAQLGILPVDLRSAHWDAPSPGLDFVLDGSSGEEVVLPLAGEHQLENAALAILIATQLRKFFPISDTNIIEGLEHTRHPGRLEWLKVRETRILLDGAHNQSGANALAKYLEVQWPEASIALVYGSMKDKDFEGILTVLLPLVNDLILTESPNVRSMPANEIAKALSSKPGSVRPLVVSDVEQALDSAVQLATTYPATRPAFVLVTGSLYLVGEASRIFKSQI